MRPLPGLRRVLVDNAEKAIRVLLPEKRIYGIVFCHGFLKLFLPDFN